MLLSLSNLHLNNSSSNIIHVTASENAANIGASLYFSEGSHPVVNNSIFWNSSDFQIACSNSSPESGLNSLILTYSNVGGSDNNYSTDNEYFNDNGSDIDDKDDDPQFNIEFGAMSIPFSVGDYTWGSDYDYSLEVSSPCLNSGDPALMDPDGTFADRGAFYHEFIVGCSIEGAENYNADVNLACDDDIGSVCINGQVLINCCCELIDMQVWYVSPTGNDANDGLSESSSFATIQRGVDYAADDDIIYVQDGTYLENITVRKAVNIFSYYMID